MFRFNPFTQKLDMTSTATGGTGNKPQTGAGAPNGVITATYAGDEYVDTVTGIKYTNPTASITGREIVQTAPAL